MPRGLQLILAFETRNVTSLQHLLGAARERKFEDVPELREERSVALGAIRPVCIWYTLWLAGPTGGPYALG